MNNMSITNHHKIQQINDMAKKNFVYAEEQFRLEMNTIAKERADVLLEARRSLEQYAIEKVNKGYSQ